MEPDFWLSRWEKGETGFHQDEIHPYLNQYWFRLKAAQGVFVPLCGKSLDMQWLHRQGLPVKGVELSELAVKAFFQSMGLIPEVHRGDPDCWSGGGIEILCGDFFAMTQLTGCDAIYDRAALIAMPPDLRPAYAQKIRQLFPHGTPMLLITLEYPQAEMNGPPFSVSEDEVRQLYAGASIEKLTHRDVLQNNERFRQRGVSRLFENAYLITL